MTGLGTWIVQVLGFAATAGIISGLLTHALNQRQVEKQRRSASAYTAMRLAVIFEHFADDCTDISLRNANVDSSKGAAVDHVTQLPKLGSFPAEDDGWKALPAHLLDDVLSFQQRIKMADSIIKSAFDYAEQSDAVMETNEQCILLGSRAWNLATKLRSSHGFAPLGLEFPFHEHLLEKLPAVRERRKSFGSIDQAE
jgi:hypothetical protein